jgi:hypothetical protein
LEQETRTCVLLAKEVDGIHLVIAPIVGSVESQSACSEVILALIVETLRELLKPGTLEIKPD